MTTVTHPAETASPAPDLDEPGTVRQRIAAGLGDPTGTYQLLVGAHICAALHIDPELRGQLVGQPLVSASTLSWLSGLAASPDAAADHAREALAALRS